MKNSLVRLFFFFTLWVGIDARLEAIEVRKVNGVAMSVSNLERSIDFYTHVLSFKKVSASEIDGDEAEKLWGVFGAHIRIARLTLGDEMIELREFLSPEGQPVPTDTRSNDQWFQHIAIVVRDMDSAYEILRKNNVRYSSPRPQRLPDWNKNAGGIKAFYFKDPDGHPLEILEFPQGKGDPKWHRPGENLFMGIDHTAIVVSSTDQSLRFYQDLLGLRVAGKSENYGIEQERLNNIFGAHLRITGLKANEGPGIEFLEYLSPADGRSALRSTKANDLVATQTLFFVDQAEEAYDDLKKSRANLVSSGVVSMTKRDLGFSEGLSALDPDGHAVLLIEK